MWDYPANWRWWSWLSGIANLKLIFAVSRIKYGLLQIDFVDKKALDLSFL
jgi:hypothetical protein